SSSSVLSSFKSTAPTATHPLSLHDALPICSLPPSARDEGGQLVAGSTRPQRPSQIGSVRGVETAIPLPVRGETASIAGAAEGRRSEEHTSELQSLTNLVCRLLLEKKKPQQH